MKTRQIFKGALFCVIGIITILSVIMLFGCDVENTTNSSLNQLEQLNPEQQQEGTETYFITKTGSWVGPSHWKWDPTIFKSIDEFIDENGEDAGWLRLLNEVEANTSLKLNAEFFDEYNLARIHYYDYSEIKLEIKKLEVIEDVLNIDLNCNIPKDLPLEIIRKPIDAKIRPVSFYNICIPIEKASFNGEKAILNIIDVFPVGHVDFPNGFIEKIGYMKNFK